MTEEIFGPILTVRTMRYICLFQIYVYEDNDWTRVLRLVDESSDYALTGSMFDLNIPPYLTIVLQPTVQPL